MASFLKTLMKDEAGQSTTEYILILSVVVMIALKFKKEAEPKLIKLTGDVFGKISDFATE